jgi:hypothetical protein
MASNGTDPQAESNQAANGRRLDWLSQYINQQIGELPLSEVNNFSVKQFVAKMSAEEKNGKARFAPKSVTHYVQIIKMVVGSALDDKGEPLYPVKWNHNFMDLPEIGKQRKPAFKFCVRASCPDCGCHSGRVPSCARGCVAVCRARFH